jgi:hypothetical protein
MQINMAKSTKIRASKQEYVSPGQGVLPCFGLPFSGSLLPDNRWVVLAHKIPWDLLVKIYLKQMRNEHTGAVGINPRVAIGAMIIKHICDLSDRETIQQIRENVYMQYFLGYSGFSNALPFDSSLFVELRNRLGMEQINDINERIIEYVREQTASSTPESSSHEEPQQSVSNPENPVKDEDISDKEENQSAQSTENVLPENRGRMIIDATVCPQDIAYPTDLNLLNDARKKSEELIDVLYDPALHGEKPRTYRRKARKQYLMEAQKKSSTSKAIRKANGKQLCYLKRNIGILHRLLDKYKGIPLDRVQYKYLLVIQTLYDQQAWMHQNKVHSIEGRIVSIHQPHIRPIVRGKRNAKVEFGARIQVSLMNGFTFLDDLEWEAFNEGSRLMASVEKYRKRFGYYPAEVLVTDFHVQKRALILRRSVRVEHDFFVI